MTRSLRILVAEDEPLNALALHSQLEALGHRVLGPARTGEQVVQMAALESMDLAILDIRLPGISGLEAAEEIFTSRPVPIILLTGYSDPAYIAQATLTPVFHYLVKPISLEDLKPAIGVACSRFEEWSQFTDEAQALERKLEDRTVLERAKTLLMHARGISEAGAYKLLQRESQSRNRTMVDIARSIVLAHSLLNDDLSP